MSRLNNRPGRRFRWTAWSVGAASAVVLTAVLAGPTVARMFTLNVATHAPVTNQSHKTVHESIVVDSAAKAVYSLSGDSKSHPECRKANHCFRFWPPVKVASARRLSKAPGVPGKLGTWKRDGFIQVTLGGHPLYTFAGDKMKRHATGQGIKAFGGTWSVAKARSTARGYG